MSEHTKGRLVVKDFECRAFLLTEADDDIAFDILKPNARRLAACWNALEKIDQKTLDMGWTGIGCMEAAHKHEERAATFAKDIEILAKKLVDMNFTRVEMEKQHTNLLLAFHSASSEITAARALLREQLKHDDEAVADMKALGLDHRLPADALDLSARIRSYLDACDTLEGAPNAG